MACRGTAHCATVCLGLVCSGAGTYAAEPLRQLTPDLVQAPGGGKLTLAVTPRDRIKVGSDSWRLEFDLRNGGRLDTVIFPHGSRKNVLVQPFRMSVDGYSDADSPEVRVQTSEKPGLLVLRMRGRMGAAGREPGPIEFENTWTITPFVVRVDSKLVFLSTESVSRVGVLSTAVRGDLNEFGFRQGAGGNLEVASRRRATYLTVGAGSGRRLLWERHMPLYLFLFRKGVEGFDLCPASQLAAWENGLAGTPGLGAYEVRHSSDSGGTHIDLEPLRAARPVQVRQGSYTFSYYLGLPRITEKSNRKWRHLSFGNHPWPSDEEIRRWAENGVNLVRLHNDYSEDGVFWHAASWPPYDAKGMAEMRRVIAACHRHKILIVPYFSLLSFHPESEGYEEHAKVWSRTTDELGTVVHSRVGKGEYGAQMCLRSNWIERRKRDIEKAYRELGFDGIYYDSVNSFLCRNRQHSTSLHSTIDGLVEILAWTRRLIAPHGVLVVHSYVPFTSIVLENFGDALVNMEHLSLSKETLKLQDVPTVSLQAEGVPRLPCPSYVEDRIVERNQNNIAQFVVLGMFPGYRATGPSIAGAGGPAYDLTLQLFRAFKAYRLEDYRFHNAFSGAVRTAWEDVYGAVYEGADPTLVVLSNTGSEPRRKVSWRLNPAIFGRDAPSRLTVKDVKSGSIQTIGPAALVDGSLETGLQPYEYRLFEIRAAR